MKHFFLGIARLFGLIDHSEITTILKRTDADAVAGDWRAVGDYLYKAMGMKRK